MSHTERGNPTYTKAPDESYSMFLAFGESYELSASCSGYFPIIDTLDLRNPSKHKELERDLYMLPVELGETFVLNHVYFYRASEELLEASFPELNRLLALLNNSPSLEIELRGHTDNIGSEAELQLLSELRAETVMLYLMRRGIDAKRLSSQGFGSSQPIASNENPQTRKLNRRVEFRIIKR